MATFFRTQLIVLSLITATVAPAWAFGGPDGCIGLPEYYRALGALQGMASCYMTTEQARRVVASYDGASTEARQVAPVLRTPFRRNKRQRPRKS